ncbi:MAG TPA: CinA family nicotinamide mononucleotide deamidase-related protein [Phycisphaerales bacterium]|nr:CinA family nicotinamide mononucleotide deamidase-related protein [Phycisphaerales bacterium]
MTIHHRRAFILSMGDELTLGQSLDTNAQWVARQLVERGIVPVEHVTAPDDLGVITATFARAAASADLIISTGGLGPTADDLTREGLARASGDTLIEDADAIKEIEAWFAKRGRPMMSINRVQAMRPSRGEAISNRWGTAPGLYAKIGNAECFCLPGPPSEMKPMFEAAVAPRLSTPPGFVVLVRTLQTTGLGESEIATRLGALMQRDAKVLVGTTASQGIVSIRVRYEGMEGREEAMHMVDEVMERCRAAVAGHVVSEDDLPLAECVLREARRAGLTLATVESCTGGLIAAQLTEIAGSSDVFLGGWVTYANELKIGQVGVAEETLRVHGAVSAQTAAEMARGGLAMSGGGLSIAVTGVAGPGGGTVEKPVGTVHIAVAAADGRLDARHFKMAGGRESVRAWSVRSGLLMALWMIRGGLAPKLLREV